MQIVNFLMRSPLFTALFLLPPLAVRNKTWYNYNIKNKGENYDIQKF